MKKEKKGKRVPEKVLRGDQGSQSPGSTGNPWKYMFNDFASATSWVKSEYLYRREGEDNQK